MSIWNQTAKTGESYETPSEANHPGALVALIDLGTHRETYKDGKTNDVRKIMLVFELDEKSETLGGNHTIRKEVTLTTSPKSSLRKIMESMRGRAYAEGETIDITKAVGRPCLCNVKHKISGTGNTYANLESVSPLPKGMPPFKPTYPLTQWELDCGRPFPEFKWLPHAFLNGQLTPLKNIMEASKEMRGGSAPAPAQQPANGTPAAPQSDADEEQIPF